jgi:hypothetical protein
MPWAPLATEYEVGDASSGSGGVVVTANTTINTEGSYAEIIASTSIDAGGFRLTIHEGTKIAAEYLFDIAIGAGGSEQVIVADIPFSHGSTSGAGASVSCFIPLAIPAGTRIAARCQANVTGSGTLLVTVHLIAPTFMGVGDSLGEAETIGATAADSGGTAIDPGGTINTKSTPVQLSASISTDWKALMFCVSRSAANRALTNMEHTFDVMVGAASSEVVVVPDIQTSQVTSYDANMPYVQGPFPCSIPAGSRVSVRAQASAATANDRVVDVILIGFS